MANVYEGAPDSRQSDDTQMPVSRFRPRYRALTEEEKARRGLLKERYAAIETLIGELKPGRYTALAITELEASCMWAVKALTS